MEDVKKTEISITDNRLPKWLRRLFSTAILLGGPITIGVLFGSSAMQWMAFVISILLFIGYALRSNAQNTFGSVDEAIKYLEKIR